MRFLLKVSLPVEKAKRRGGRRQPGQEDPVHSFRAQPRGGLLRYRRPGQAVRLHLLRHAGTLPDSSRRRTLVSGLQRRRRDPPGDETGRSGKGRTSLQEGSQEVRLTLDARRVVERCSKNVEERHTITRGGKCGPGELPSVCAATHFVQF